jgi:hypothetical protein
MRPAEGEVKVRALDRRTETDADDFKILHESRGDADDHVLNEAAGGAVEGFVLTKLGGAGDDNGAVFAGERDAFGKREVEFALRAFDDHRAAVKFDSDLRGDRDWFESDS